MKFSNQFSAFIENNAVPTSDQGKSALLTESRSAILALLDLEKKRMDAASARSTATASATPVVAKAPAPVASKPQPVASIKPAQVTAATITAADIEAKIPRMALSEFKKLSPSSKMKYIKDGGKLTE